MGFDPLTVERGRLLHVHFRFLIRMAPSPCKSAWKRDRIAQDLARTPASFKTHFLHLVLGEAIMIFVFTIVFASGAGAGEDDTGNDCFEP
jgi:hypothetical protein